MRLSPATQLMGDRFAKLMENIRSDHHFGNRNTFVACGNLVNEFIRELMAEDSILEQRIQKLLRQTIGTEYAPLQEKLTQQFAWQASYKEPIDQTEELLRLGLSRHLITQLLWLFGQLKGQMFEAINTIRTDPRTVAMLPNELLAVLCRLQTVPIDSVPTDEEIFTYKLPSFELSLSFSRRIFSGLEQFTATIAGPIAIFLVMRDLIRVLGNPIGEKWLTD